MRVSRAMQQLELAAAAGVHLSTVQRVEAGGAVSMATLRGLARALNVEPAVLMRPPPEQRL
jgi:transcriptional regulator with XRE-family HTH domain